MKPFFFNLLFFSGKFRWGRLRRRIICLFQFPKKSSKRIKSQNKKIDRFLTTNGFKDTTPKKLISPPPISKHQHCRDQCELWPMHMNQFKEHHSRHFLSEKHWASYQHNTFTIDFQWMWFTIIGNLLIVDMLYALNFNLIVLQSYLF